MISIVAPNWNILFCHWSAPKRWQLLNFPFPLRSYKFFIGLIRSCCSIHKTCYWVHNEFRRPSHSLDLANRFRVEHHFITGCFDIHFWHFIYCGRCCHHCIFLCARFCISLFSIQLSLCCPSARFSRFCGGLLKWFIRLFWNSSTCIWAAFQVCRDIRSHTFYI